MKTDHVMRLRIIFFLLSFIASVIEAKEVEEKQQRWAAFPVIASSPETGFILGGMLFHFLPVDNLEKQASTIDMIAFGTTKGQYLASLASNIFSNDGLYMIKTGITFSSWKANYYSIGNDSPDISEDYKSKTVKANFILQRRFSDSFTVDLIGNFQDINMEVETGGMLETHNIAGHEDGQYIGMGVAVGYDTRDNINSPRTGNLARYEYLQYNSDFGSDLDFSIQTLDLRHYHKIPLIKDSVLAMATKIRQTQGTVPFQELSSPDGTYVLRAIENGRYRDKDMLALQLEYRFPVKWKFSSAVFAEAAQVANDLTDIEIDSFKTSFGAGIRYALNAKQRFNLRADLAWVDEGIGFVINVRSAF
jgi:outer membrane protein assembly factor BamA